MQNEVTLKYRKEYKHAGESFTGRIVSRESDGAKCFRFMCEPLGYEIEVLLDAFEPA